MAFAFGEGHGHIFMDGIDYKHMREKYARGIDEADLRRKLEAYRSRGIRFFRDGGDPYGAGVRARELAGEYGIDYRSPVFAIHKKGHYGGIVGRAFADLREYRTLVREAKGLGADFVKVMLSGILDFSGDGSVTEEPLSGEEIRRMIGIAHDEGLSVMAHVNGAAPILAAAEAGADSIEHGNFMDEEGVWALAEHQVIWVPTYVTIHNLLSFDRYDHTLIRRLEKLQEERIRQADRAGVCIALGSDAGAYGVFHGTGILQEYACIREILGKTPETENRLALAQKALEDRFHR